MPDQEGFDLLAIFLGEQAACRVKQFTTLPEQRPNGIQQARLLCREFGHVFDVDVAQPRLDARRQALELLDLLKRHSPRFRNAFLLKMACQIGIRETRRVMGGYVLTEDDVLQARKFLDGIARSNYPVDIHNPAGTGTVIKPVPKGDWYEIPYRCLVPRRTANLLVGSRCISSTHEAHSSMRVMPVVACIGEAAGAAAAHCAKRGTGPAGLDGGELKREILG